MREFSLVNAAAALIWQNGKFLASLRPEGKIMGGCWELPGGKIEPGETAATALKRELNEELGIVIINFAYWKTFDYFYAEEKIKVTLNFFEVAKFTGKPYGKEGQALAWITPGDWEKYNFLPADEKILCEVARRFPYRMS